jgi:hypothetical protein
MSLRYTMSWDELAAHIIGTIVATILEKLKALAAMPQSEPGPWLAGAEESVRFLKEHLEGETTILYASLNAIYIHGVLVPEAALEDISHEELSREFISPDASWIIEHASGGGEPDRVYLEPPLRRLGERFKDGEKLVFKRSFLGRKGPSPVEISQRLVHALDLHTVEELNAWCRLDDDGDIVEIVKIVREYFDDWTKDVTLVTIPTKELAEYMRLSGSALLYFFDFTRTNLRSFQGWSDTMPIKFDAPDLFYHGGINGQGSYINGRMIVRPAITYEAIVAEHMERRNPTSRQYATFKAIDLEKRERIEVSADPKGLRNYFQPPSQKPLEMSPAFFRAEVLQRYKADSEKYDVADRSITCRGAWTLRTYDINDKGQVTTYLRYLGELPYKEQLYWQSFNEWPKAWLAERTITTDFKGEFDGREDPLNEIKSAVRRLDETAPGWWQSRGEDARKAVRYPVTSSQSEWGNEILALDQLVNEGFLPTPLRKRAESMDIKVQPDWRQFKLIEEILAKKSGDAADARALVDPLRALRDLRNHLKGHASDKKQALAKDALTKFGSFKGHYQTICKDVHESLKAITAALS